MRRTSMAAIVVLLAGAAGAGWLWLKRAPAPTATDAVPVVPPAQAAPGPDRAGVDIDPRRLQAIGVRIVKAERASTSAEIRATGSVQYDETRVRDVNVKIDGWIRDLRVDYTGQTVQKDQTLFTLFSLDLLTAEGEYILALKARDQMRTSPIAEALSRADQLAAAARRRLALWDLTEDDLRTIETTRETSDVVPIRSPASGIVMEKSVVQGQHVAVGQTLYRLADLSVVWVEADAYEHELPFVRIGDRATITLDAYPREPLAGRVIYIYPNVNPQTRTVKVRYEVPNNRGRLKPGMFAAVVMSAPAGSAVTVPIDAVLDSGKEQVVFVARGEGHFEPRPVTVARRVGDRIQIAAGLQPGDEVATGATFFLDSESQMRASVGQFEQALPASPAAPVARLQIALATTPSPPITGENQFQATVKDAAGQPIDGADVVVQLYMPAMPTMGMPAMKSEIRLSSAGGGLYRGTGQVMMAGRWDATVTVSRSGVRLGSAPLPLVAR